MSLSAREALVSSGLTFTDATQKPDLLDPAKTNTWLIDALARLKKAYPGGVLITAVRTDHPTQDASWQHSGGDAVDCYPADWAKGEDTAVLRFAQAVATCADWRNIGLGGKAMGAWKVLTPWGNIAGHTLFQDNSSSHFHLSVGSPQGVGP